MTEPPAADATSFLVLSPEMFAGALPDMLSIYAAAMGYEPATTAARSPLWLDHSLREGFRCVAAVSDNAHESGHTPGLAGFGYGYRGAPGQWWYGEVARGLGSPTHAALADYFELTELHVRPSFQGHGIGESMMRALLGPVESRAVLLSTPEGENRAWRLYRRLGFRDVLRHFHFQGDSRPFAVLGRALPLPSVAGITATPTAS